MSAPWNVVIFVLGGLAAVFLAEGERVRKWWRRRFRQPVRLEECEKCGAQLKPKQVHELREYPDDDNQIGIIGGGSYMSATYCAKHCPGGCDRHCTPVL